MLSRRALWLDSIWGGTPLGVIRPDGATLGEPLSDGYHENCAYSHPNYTDGFLRTSVNQLSIWARLWLDDGSVDGARLLSADTVRQVYGGTDFLQGLTWHSGHELDGYRLWGHGGGDPGVNTDLLMLREKRLAAIVFANTSGVTPGDFTVEMLREGLAQRSTF
jgi:CubicO group peptidase (beta-lactamase class C family)